MANDETVILGNGVAGITAAMTLRERDARTRIRVVSGETDYYFSRTALMYAFMDKLDRPDLEPFERKVYAARGIELVRDQAVDLDADARTLTLARGGALRYDRLLLATGSVPRRLDVPGLDAARAGVVNFVSMQDLDACEALVPSTREAVVVGGGLIGIELVECLLHHGITTTFVVREPWYWPVALCREEGERITEHMRHHGAIVRHDDEVSEVQTDAATGRVRAVVTRAGGTLPAQMLGVCIGVEPATGFLAKARTPPVLGRGIVVDEYLRTSLRDVWAAGDCAEIRFGPSDPRAWPYRSHLAPPEANGAQQPLVEQIWYSAKRQGELAGRNMRAARPEPYRPPVFYNSAKFLDVEYTTVGDLLALPAGTRAVYREHRRKLITQRVLHHEGRVVGFNMLGSRWDHAVLARWIDEQRELAWVLANLRAAQFDVEFGRANLSDFTERELPVHARAHRDGASTPGAASASGASGGSTASAGAGRGTTSDAAEGDAPSTAGDGR